MAKQENVVVAYKGFDKNLKCREFQYEVGKTYTHDGKTEICASGFHACENPLDVWNYYGPADSRFCVVEQSEGIARHDEDSKVVSAKITIKAEIELGEYIRKVVDWIIAACGKKSGKDIQSASGHYAKLAASGSDAKLAASGSDAKLAASGDGAQLAASGHYAKLAASGENCVIASSSYASTAKGSKGTWISLASFDRDGKCNGFAVGCVGEKGIKADTYYRAKNGKLVEVE